VPLSQDGEEEYSVVKSGATSKKKLNTFFVSVVTCLFRCTCGLNVSALRPRVTRNLRLLRCCHNFRSNQDETQPRRRSVEAR
jgi:hypothetical protein